MRDANTLSALAIKCKNKPGRYHDGNGLYLQVSKAGTKSWLYRFMLRGKARQMGLGPVDLVSLSEAREKARTARKLVYEGIDPIEARKSDRLHDYLAAARALSFKDCALAYIEAHEPSWKNDKHRAQWRSTLSSYVYPVFGNMPVAEIDTALVMRVLQPIWTTKPETAGRVRGRIESVLDWASAQNYRQGENPARWRGHLDKLLPARTKLMKVKHHAALPYQDIGAFMVQLRGVEGVSACALEFLILTAARTSEVLNAEITEIKNGVWTIPPERMKAGKEHRVPLSDAAQAVIDGLSNEGVFLFPGTKAKSPLSNMSMAKTVHRLGFDATVHGFRSSFRDWAAEQTAYANHVVEMALAHTIGNKVESAYRRGDLFEKRRHLMDDWARYCAATGSADVVPIRGADHG